MSKAALWQAVSALMQHQWGGENLTRLAREAKIGPGTATRLKEQKTSVGLDTLDKLADCFGVHPWQLLVPGFDPKNPPAIETPQQHQQMYDRLVQLAKEFKPLP